MREIKLAVAVFGTRGGAAARLQAYWYLYGGDA